MCVRNYGNPTVIKRLCALWHHNRFATQHIYPSNHNRIPHKPKANPKQTPNLPLSMNINMRRIIYFLFILLLIAHDLNHYYHQNITGDQMRNLSADFDSVQLSQLQVAEPAAADSDSIQLSQTEEISLNLYRYLKQKITSAQPQPTIDQPQSPELISPSSLSSDASSSSSSITQLTPGEDRLLLAYRCFGHFKWICLVLVIGIIVLIINYSGHQININLPCCIFCVLALPQPPIISLSSCLDWSHTHLHQISLFSGAACRERNCKWAFPSAKWIE